MENCNDKIGCNGKHLQVLAGLLNIAEKADWRNCTPGKDEEVKMAENFKKRFEEFDPNQ